MKKGASPILLTGAIVTGLLLVGLISFSVVEDDKIPDNPIIDDIIIDTPIIPPVTPPVPTDVNVEYYKSKYPLQNHEIKLFFPIYDKLTDDTAAEMASKYNLLIT